MKKEYMLTESVMKKAIALLSALLLILVSVLPSTWVSGQLGVKNPGHLVVATIEGSPPETVDPAWCYDSASGELIFNVYETLLFYDGERVESLVPRLAADWHIENITGTTSPEGLPWYYRYVFRIRTGVLFHGGGWGSPSKYELTAEDVEYSFERGMIQDRDGGPQWMLYEPLLNTLGAADLGNFSETEDIIRVGKMIDHAVESNSTHVWFNLAKPYAPFLQILAQPWSSILSKEWINDYVIGMLAKPEWKGDWGNYAEWISYHNPEVSPLDDPWPVMCGTGPYQLEAYESEEEYWSITRFLKYWRGWPTGHNVERVTVTWHYLWETRRDMFLAGDVDFCAVIREYMDQVLGQPGIRCIYPLPALICSALFFNFNVDPLASYRYKINDYGVFSEDGIPRDFFGNPEWGVHVRKAFAYALDYYSYLRGVFRGEAIQPSTAVIVGLPYFDQSTPKYSYNLTKAEEEFKMVPDLWDTGFNLSLVYNTGNRARKTACELLEDAVETLNSKFHVIVESVPWGMGIISRYFSCFSLGWLVDYPDPHNFVVPFYASYGMLAEWQSYSNPVMDELIELGVGDYDPVLRGQIYGEIQALAIEDCPSIVLSQPVGRHFEREWVNGWYYNSIFPGVYAYPLWKEDLPREDLNSDGEVNIIDVAVVAKSFGSYCALPDIHPRWNSRADLYQDQKINILDLAAFAKTFENTHAG